MGGRGASSGVSEKENAYGTQFRTILKSGNIKFVEPTENNEEPLLETMTRGRVYVLVGEKGLKNINYYGNDLKRIKRIDLDHSHQGMKPHVQHGYYSNEIDIETGVIKEATKLTPEEKKMVDRVLELWDNYNKGK